MNFCTVKKLFLHFSTVYERKSSMEDSAESFRPCTIEKRKKESASIRNRFVYFSADFDEMIALKYTNIFTFITLCDTKQAWNAFPQAHAPGSFIAGPGFSQNPLSRYPALLFFTKFSQFHEIRYTLTPNFSKVTVPSSVSPQVSSRMGRFSAICAGSCW